MVANDLCYHLTADYTQGPFFCDEQRMLAQQAPSLLHIVECPDCLLDHCRALPWVARVV
jgi:hypothetical protein